MDATCEGSQRHAGDGRRASCSTGVYCVTSAEMWMPTYYWMIMLITGASGGDTNNGEGDNHFIY